MIGVNRRMSDWTAHGGAVWLISEGFVDKARETSELRNAHRVLNRINEGIRKGIDSEMKTLQ